LGQLQQRRALHLQAELFRLFLRFSPMRLIHALAAREASRLREVALAEEGAGMAEVTALGRTAFLASNARRAEAQAPEPLYSADLDMLFESRVFAATLLRARLPMLAIAAREQAAAKDGSAEEMPAWLGIGSSTAFFDDRLRRALAEGTRQVVSLGSGFDCRAMRLERPDGTLFVEVDEGPLLDFKMQRLADAGHGPYPAAIVRGSYLGLDLLDELVKVGVDPKEPVFFLWEANTMYLPPERARSFLGALLRDFPRCEVIFDYFTEPVAGPGGPKKTGCAETDRDLEILVRAVGDGEWLLVGPWDSELAQRELGFEVIEQLSLREVVRAVRGEAVAAPLLQRHRRDFEVGLHACQHFCRLRPGRGGSVGESTESAGGDDYRGGGGGGG